MNKYEKFLSFLRRELPIKEANLKKFKNLPRHLMDYFEMKRLLGKKINKVEIGYSKRNPHKLIVTLADNNTGDVFRFNFTTNDDNFIISADTFSHSMNSDVILHSLKDGSNKLKKPELVELKSLQSIIMNFFEKSGLVKK